MNRNDVITSLTQVIDPEVGINIIDMGLIYKVNILYNNQVIDDTDTIVELDMNNIQIEIDYTLTFPGCPLADIIEADILSTIENNFHVPCILNLTWDPPWHMDFVSEEARLSLGFPI